MLDYSDDSIVSIAPYWTWTSNESGAAQVVETTRRDAGRRRRKRYFVEIDGQEFDVNSVEEAETILLQAKQLAVQIIEKARASYIVKPGIKLPQIRTPNKELVPVIQKARAELKDLYGQLQRDLEIKYLLAKAEEEEEEAILRLLM